MHPLFFFDLATLIQAGQFIVLFTLAMVLIALFRVLIRAHSVLADIHINNVLRRRPRPSQTFERDNRKAA